MGPRSCERGKYKKSEKGAVSESLQWGRVRVNAERSQAQADERWWALASMGPRSCERGKTQSPGLPSITDLLQWGRVRVNAESVDWTE